MLEPFGDAETDVLIDSRLKATALDDSARERIKGAAEGNPFFVEQMLASIEEGGDGADAAVPPTIQTLLAARLDRLDLEERRVDAPEDFHYDKILFVPGDLFQYAF